MDCMLNFNIHYIKESMLRPREKVCLTIEKKKEECGCGAIRKCDHSKK